MNNLKFASKNRIKVLLNSKSDLNRTILVSLSNLKTKIVTRFLVPPILAYLEQLSSSQMLD